MYINVSFYEDLSKYISFNDTDMEEYTPLVTGWFCTAFNICISILFLIGLLVHRAIYRMFKRLGSRHINHVVIPALVS